MDFSLLIPLVAVSIQLVALLRSPFKEWLKVKERSLEIAASDAAEKAAQYAAKTERLEQRMAVLERIITDRSSHLADEIDSLRDKPLN